MNKIIYLDAAASALKSDAVIATQVAFLKNSYANTGRGVCARAAAADEMLMRAREKVAAFIEPGDFYIGDNRWNEQNREHCAGCA